MSSQGRLAWQLEKSTDRRPQRRMPGCRKISDAHALRRLIRRSRVHRKLRRRPSRRLLAAVRLTSLHRFGISRFSQCRGVMSRDMAQCGACPVFRLRAGMLGGQRGRHRRPCCSSSRVGAPPHFSSVLRTIDTPCFSASSRADAPARSVAADDFPARTCAACALSASTVAPSTASRIA